MRYLGAGVGLSIVHSARASLGGPAPEAPLRRADLPWLAAVIIFGGELGPLSLMQGLSLTSAASGSLLLILEGIAAMAMASILFRENVDRWLVTGAFAIVLGVVIRSCNGQGLSFVWGLPSSSQLACAGALIPT